MGDSVGKVDLGEHPDDEEAQEASDEDE